MSCTELDQRYKKLVADAVRDGCAQLELFSLSILGKLELHITTRLNSIVNTVVSRTVQEVLDEISVPTLVHRAIEVADINQTVAESVGQLIQIGMDEALQSYRIIIEEHFTELKEQTALRSSRLDTPVLELRSPRILDGDFDRKLQEALELFADGTNTVLEAELKPQMMITAQCLMDAQLTQAVEALRQVGKEERAKLKLATRTLAEHTKSALDATSSITVHQRIREAYRTLKNSNECDPVLLG